MTGRIGNGISVLQPFDAEAIENEWRTVPSDLAGWSMRATAMLILATRYHRELIDAQADRKMMQAALLAVCDHGDIAAVRIARAALAATAPRPEHD